MLIKMTVINILNNGVASILNDGGLTTTVNIISYTFIDTDYDDEVQQTQTGSIAVSGLIFPIKSTQGSSEALLLEQGTLLTEDKMLYTGSVNVSGNIIVELNSGEYYSIIPDGIQSWETSGSIIYQKMFLRRNLAGSIF